MGLANPPRTTMTLDSCNRRRSRRFVAEQVLVYVSANGESFRFPTLSLCQSSAIIGHFTPRCHPMLLQHLVSSREPQYRLRYYWSQFAHRRQLFLQPIIFTRLPNSVVQTILLLLLLSPSSRIPHPPSSVPFCVNTCVEGLSALNYGSPLLFIPPPSSGLDQLYIYPMIL